MHACLRSRRASRSCGCRPHDFRGPVPQGRDRSTCRARSHRAVRRSSARRSRRCGACGSHESELPVETDRDVAELEAAIDAHPLHGAPGLDAALRAAWQADRIAPRRRPARSARREPQRVPGPPVRPRARRARGVGLRRRLDAHRRGRAPHPPEHRRRPRARRSAAGGPPRRPRRADARRARVVLHVPAPRPGSATSRCRRARWPNQVVSRRSRAVDACGATCTSPNATRACPRRAGPTPDSPPRSTPGRAATSSPTSSTTRR